MMDGVSIAHRRADSALVAAVSFVILGIAPLVSINVFAEKLTEVFSTRPTLAQSIEAPVELAGARLTAESECLAQVMYYEARGEGIDGQKAVAEVALQRTRNRNYASTVCGVVHEGIEPGRRDCQFTFACDGSMMRPKEVAVWDQVRLLAEKIMTGQVRLAGETGRAIAYHSVDVTPPWAENMLKTAQIGKHIFYRFVPRDAVTGVSAQANQAKPTVATQPKVQTVSAVGNGA